MVLKKKNTGCEHISMRVHLFFGLMVRTNLCIRYLLLAVLM